MVEAVDPGEPLGRHPDLLPKERDEPAIGKAGLGPQRGDRPAAAGVGDTPGDPMYRGIHGARVRTPELLAEPRDCAPHPVNPAAGIVTPLGQLLTGAAQQVADIRGQLGELTQRVRQQRPGAREKMPVTHAAGVGTAPAVVTSR